jgi:transposase
VRISLDAEAADLESQLELLLAEIAPELLAEPGVGPISAAQLLIVYSHTGRLRSEAAFASLAGAAPIPASSGQTVRYRLNRAGDRQLNRALHTIALPASTITTRPAPTRNDAPPKARPPERSSAA